MANNEYSFDTDMVSRLIRKRRTIKPSAYDDRPVPKAVIEKIIENAHWAPTHGQTFPWRFFICCGDARNELANTLCDIYRMITTKDSFKEKKYTGIRQNVLASPVTISIAMKRDETEKIQEIDEVMAVGCAVQNMHLTATAYGLGGFWSTHSAATSKRYCDHLGLSPSDKALGLFFIGYPRKLWPVGKRGPITEIACWEDSL